MHNIWLDIDLDYFNCSRDPIGELKSILELTSPKTPAGIVVEHHIALSHLDNAIENGSINLPFDILHVDEHSDWYGSYRFQHQEQDGLTLRQLLRDPKIKIDCGNFFWYLDANLINSFVWLGNDRSEECDEVFSDYAIEYFREHEINFSFTREQNTPKRIISSPRRVGLVTITVSPDYMGLDLLKRAKDLIELAKDYYGLDKFVKPEGSPRLVSSWVTVHQNGPNIIQIPEDNFCKEHIVV